MFASVIDALQAALREPYAVITDPANRVYAPFVLGSLVIGFGVLWWQRRSGAVAARGLLAPKVWWHASSRMDAKLLVLKAFLRPLLFAPIALSAYGIAVWVFTELTARYGDAGPSSLSRFEITMLYTVVLFVSWDASRYLVHRLLHRIPALWEIHKVHHSAEVLTPLTVHRTHPIESFLFGLRGAVVTGVITGLFFYLFRDKAVQLELLGVNAFGVAFNALGANLRHSHVWLSYGPVLERIFISPAQHQLHHSTDPDDYDCNFGSFLAIWDRIGGSLRLAGKRRRLEFGLTADELNHDPTRAGSAVLGPLTAWIRRRRP